MKGWNANQQNKKRYELKHAQRSMMRTAVKRVEKAVETKDKNKKIMKQNNNIFYLHFFN